MKEDTDVQKQRKAKKKYPKILYHLFVAALALLMVYPLIWMVCSSFKETNTIFRLRQSSSRNILRCKTT